MGPLRQAQPGGIRHVARVFCALAGGVVHSDADREAAAAVEARWPGTAAQIQSARAFHARVAAWAAGSQGARGLIVTPAGYPCDPDPHDAFLKAAPDAKVLLADTDEEVSWVNQEVLGADPRVTVARVPASSPAAMMSSAEARELPRPLCLIIPFAAMMLPPETCAAALAVYGRVLPAGSVVALSLWTPDGGPAGEEFLREWGPLVAPAWGHTAEDVAGWIRGAGMRAVRKPRDLRAREGREWAEEDLARRSPGRMTGAVARLR